jgi:hypothetical protein
MKPINFQLKPQDIVILMKIIALGSEEWSQKPLADSLHMSQSEISQALARLRYSGLLSENKKIMKLALMDFLQYALRYVFPQHPGPIVRGVPTAHSAYPLNEKILGSESYVWPHSKGKVRGQAIYPLYVTVPDAIVHDESFYQLMTLLDVLRVGRNREKDLAIKELRMRILDGK